MRNCIGAVCEGNVVVAVGVTSRNGVGACIGALSLGERYYLRQSLTAHKLQRTFGVAHRERNKVFAVHACFVVNYNGNCTFCNCVTALCVGKGDRVVVVCAGARDVVTTHVACGRGQGVHGAVVCKHATRGNLACQRCNFVAVHAFFVVHGNGNSTLRNCVGAVCEVYGVVAVCAGTRYCVGACRRSVLFGKRNNVFKSFGVCHAVCGSCGKRNKAVAVHACFVVNYNGNGT